MNISLTQKEKMLLQDQKSHEEICVNKYNQYAKQAKDPALKQVFEDNGRQEQQHLETINQILNGEISNVSGQQNQQPQQNLQGNANQTSVQKGQYDENDKKLCADILMTEKYVSNTYDTAIFESTDTNLRQTLNHIQKEEQQHGENVFKYMESAGMYTPQQ